MDEFARIVAQQDLPFKPQDDLVQCNIRLPTPNYRAKRMDYYFGQLRKMAQGKRSDELIFDGKPLEVQNR